MQTTDDFLSHLRKISKHCLMYFTRQCGWLKKLAPFLSLSELDVDHVHLNGSIGRDAATSPATEKEEIEEFNFWFENLEHRRDFSSSATNWRYFIVVLKQNYLQKILQNHTLYQI